MSQPEGHLAHSLSCHSYLHCQYLSPCLLPNSSWQVLCSCMLLFSCVIFPLFPLSSSLTVINPLHSHSHLPLALSLSPSYLFPHFLLLSLLLYLLYYILLSFLSLPLFLFSHCLLLTFLPPLSTQPGDYSISMKAPDRIKHFNVKNLADGRLGIGQRKFDSMDELIQHYRRAPIYTTTTEGKMYLSEGLARTVAH